MSSTTLEEPRFPPEIERSIFEYAASFERLDIPTLMRVAQRVRIWVEPILYLTIITTARPGWERFNPPFEELERYSRHVKYLLIWRKTDSAKITAYLMKCAQGLESLAIWYPICQTPWQEFVGSFRDLRRLAVRLSMLPEKKTAEGVGTGVCDFEKEEVFKRITHFELLDLPRTWTSISGLKACTNIEYFGVTDEAEDGQPPQRAEEVVGDLLAHCGFMKVVLVHDPKVEFKSEDERVVFCGMEWYEYLKDFVDQAEGRWNFWDKAEEMVNLRRASRTA
ncbi:hypothetical protein BDN72DRAFT_423301 [Pluteus cervinus]|uniref:Uncharacterized protein n=1 Tax=Pluteus cervinus TaxID=181527 RepID=A0ACD3A870_9AGAR|nr:hypothetical protein BDN72DRAFT_423301 [Pluteus cervinus]